MKLTRIVPRSHPVKIAPLAIISFFFLMNFTGIFFTRAFAPTANANTIEQVVPADVPSSGDPQLDLLIFQTAAREGLDPRFVHAVIWQESKYEQRAVSHVGARGLMQLMPATAKRFGCDNPQDAASNIEAGTKYLAWLLKRFDGDVKLALAGYNAGEGAVDKYNGIPPYNETQNYVNTIVGRYGKTYLQVLDPETAKQTFHLVAKSETTEATAVQ